MPIINNDIYIYFTDDFHKAIDKFNKAIGSQIELEECDATAYGLHLNEGADHFIAIFCTQMSRSSSLVGTIVHELYHAVAAIERNHGFNCEETGAHFIDWLTQQAMNFLDSTIEKDDAAAALKYREEKYGDSN